MSETVTVTLTEFLLARIAEDETNGRQLDHCERLVIDSDVRPEILTFANARRVLAECEAKRRIVEDFADAEREAERHDPDNPTPAYWQAWGERHGLLGALEALALPYADHEDYREEWKP